MSSTATTELFNGDFTNGSILEGEAGAATNEKHVLKRRLTLLNGVTIIVGSIIGSGIFISPTGVFVATESIGTSLLIWTLCGLLSTLGALCYAELGTCITRSGGDYAYLLEAFGPCVGFLRLWIALFIIRPTTQSIVALTFAQYAVKPFFPDCEPPESSVKLLAAACLLILTAINCLSVKWAMKIQDIFTAAKLLALVLIILAGIYFMFTNDLEHFANPWKGNYSVKNLGYAFYSGLFAFGGWNYLNFVTEELQDPFKNLPRAIWIAMPLVTAIYVLANLAYFAVVPRDDMLSSVAVAITFGNKMFGPLAVIVPIFVALSTFGGVNGILFTSARLFATGAQDGHLPTFFSLFHVEKQTPIAALIFTCGTSLIMLCTSNIILLINYFSQILWLSVAACIAALLWLRKSKPHLPRPIKVHLALPIIFLTCCLTLVLAPCVEDPFNLIMGLLITFTGLPVYLIKTRFDKKISTFGKIGKWICDACQILFNSIYIDSQEKLE